MQKWEKFKRNMNISDQIIVDGQASMTFIANLDGQW